MIKRQAYLDKLIEYSDKRFIKIITGVRRAGKSTLLQMYQQLLAETNPEEKVIYINLESFEHLSIVDEQSLRKKLELELGKLSQEESYHVLLDEVQNVVGWERVVNDLHATKLVNVIITGSNAGLLSSDVATLLSGRYVEIEVLPLSFREFLSFENVTSNDPSLLNHYFDRYMKFGGFPATVLAQSDQLKLDYLQALYDSIIVRDIIIRHVIKDAEALHRILQFVFELIGRPISIKNVIHSIESAGGKTSYASVNSYLEALEAAFVLYPVEFFELKGKKRLAASKRYYVSDTGLRNINQATPSLNRGSVLENIVYLELIRQGFTVYAGKIDEYEVDFVAERGQRRLYVQVTESLLNEKTRQREFRSLTEIKDNYPKLILSLDHFDYSQNGIKHLNLIDYLLNPN